MIDLLGLLEDQFPVKREIQVEGWPAGVFMWRLDVDDILELNAMPRETYPQMAAQSVRLCQLSLGDVDGPGLFDNERGQSWLAKHPLVLTTLAKAIREFNELSGPSEERKKKSETNESSDCSDSPENSDTGIQMLC